MPHGDDTTWIQSYTGKRVWPLDPRPEDLDIQDIAHSLALTCRYTGHCRDFYSVAQHSVHVAEIIGQAGRRQLTLTALMHDAAEAYIADVARPVKKSIPQLVEIEQKLEAVIAERFGLMFPFPEIIKEVDNIMLATERRDLMAAPPIPWKSTAGIKPREERIVAWTWQQAQREFLYLFRQLEG